MPHRRRSAVVRFRARSAHWPARGPARRGPPLRPDIAQPAPRRTRRLPPRQATDARRCPLLGPVAESAHPDTTNMATAAAAARARRGTGESDVIGLPHHNGGLERRRARRSRVSRDEIHDQVTEMGPELRHRAWGAKPPRWGKRRAAGVLALTQASVGRRLHRQLRRLIPLGSLVVGKWGESRIPLSGE